MEQRLLVEQKNLKESQEREATFQKQLNSTLDENDMLKDENGKLLSFCNDPDKSVQVSRFICRFDCLLNLIVTGSAFVACRVRVETIGIC